MKRLLKVTAMTGLLTLLKMAVGFIIVKMVAIYTGPTGLALLGQVQSLVGVLNGVITAPVGSGIVRYTAEYRKVGYEACSPWWRASLQWIFIIAFILIPVGIFFSENLAELIFKNKTFSWLVLVILFGLPFSAVGVLCNSIINGQEQYRRYIGLGMMSTLISGSLMLAMIVYNNINGALLAAAMQMALIGAVMLLANLSQPWMKIRFWFGKIDPAARKSIGGYMLMAITSAITVPVSLIIVRNILIEQIGWESTGQWQAVWKISEVYLSVITIALGTYYLPKLSTLVGGDIIVKEVNKTAKVIIPLVFMLSVIVFVFRDIIISVLFTDEFYAARNLFAFQLAGDLFKISAWLYAYPMISRGAVKWFIVTEVLFSLLFVVLTYVFVSYYGVVGASIAYCVNYFLCFIFIISNVKRFSQ